MKKLFNLILIFTLLCFPVQAIALAQGLHLEEVNKAVDGTLEAIEKLRFGPRVLPTGGGANNEGAGEQNAGADLPDLDFLNDSGFPASVSSGSGSGGGATPGTKIPLFALAAPSSATAEPL